MVNTTAKCPICARTLKIDRATGPARRYLFPHHGPDFHNGDICDASGWHVEDNELTPPPEPTTPRS